MGHREFEKKLRPVCAVEFCRPVGQFPVSKPAEEISPPERPVDDYRKATLRRHRQKAALRFAVEDVVCKLYGIHALIRHKTQHFAVTAAMGGRNADMADPARRFFDGKRVEGTFPVYQVVNLHQVEFLHAP